LNAGPTLGHSLDHEQPRTRTASGTGPFFRQHGTFLRCLYILQVGYLPVTFFPFHTFFWIVAEKFAVLARKLLYHQSGTPPRLRRDRRRRQEERSVARTRPVGEATPCGEREARVAKGAEGGGFTRKPARMVRSPELSNPVRCN